MSIIQEHLEYSDKLVAINAWERKQGSFNLVSRRNVDTGQFIKSVESSCGGDVPFGLVWQIECSQTNGAWQREQ